MKKKQKEKGKKWGKGNKRKVSKKREKKISPAAHT